MKGALCLALLMAAPLSVAAQGQQEPEKTPPWRTVAEDAQGLPLGVRAVVGPPDGPQLSGATLDLRTEEVGGLLRCPMCQGLSVADSRAGIAVNMKRQVRQMLALGYSEDQILAYFERSYGEFVRLQPPLRGVNWLVWLAPIGGLVLGGGVVAWMLRRAPASESGEKPDHAAGPDEAEHDLPGRGTLPDDEVLARHVLKVRELAYGWPGGVPPEEGA
jgi:cytochrome c-type biogenesis protein CcmH